MGLHRIYFMLFSFSKGLILKCVVLHVWESQLQWDFGKCLFDGAHPRTPSETHPVVMMRRSILRRSCLGIAHRCTRKVRGSGMEALFVCNQSSGESMLIDPLGVDDV